ncbi:MAG TPA: thioredoxin domain-containing protein [Actinomycetota bacterium]|nr:thioredoxin domain-containing protein [Actinomycetota bacterium]
MSATHGSADDRPPNRLAGETSPYLLQHAHNPVDWYPWGPEALERARREDRPILLSVGYAACHWCHVMERESFEDPETAALMNEHFVSIKVDREERPDVDAIYMDAVQAMTGSGGWPMTVFCTPDGEPFYGGTYFPDEDRHGMPAFRRVLTAVAETWRGRRDEALRQGRALAAAIARQAEVPASNEPLTDGLLVEAFQGLRRAFDPMWGGIGSAPKFPQPMTWEFALRCHLRGMPDAAEMVRTTLDRMAAGGMYDQVGGGFHRYSVDGRWHVPHFEKMLYDNAQLALLYLHGWQVLGVDRYREVVAGTLDSLLRDFRHAEGGFFSSTDADSEGVEGKFFVWSFDELVSVAGGDVARYFDASPSGNWEGTNVPWTPRPAEAVADVLGMDAGELLARVAAARPELLERRSRRVPPGTDDKVLAGWNALAIRAFAEAGRVLGEDRYVDAAVAAGEFVLRELRRADGRLLRTWREGLAGGPAYADDVALLAQACLTLHETTLDPRWYHEARGLADDLVRLFHDADRGGFFQTGTDAERLVVRPKELFDNAVPSGNSAAAEVLLRLGLLEGDASLERAGVSALRLAREGMARAPTGFGHALCALDLYVSTPREVAVVGPSGDAATRALAAQVWSSFRPNVVLASGPESDAGAGIALLAGRGLVDGRPAAYVCERFACRRPVVDPADLETELSA